MGAGLIGDVRIAVSQSIYAECVFGFRSMNDIHMYFFGYRHTFTYIAIFLAYALYRDSLSLRSSRHTLGTLTH